MHHASSQTSRHARNAGIAGRQMSGHAKHATPQIGPAGIRVVAAFRTKKTSPSNKKKTAIGIVACVTNSTLRRAARALRAKRTSRARRRKVKKMLICVRSATTSASTASFQHAGIRSVATASRSKQSVRSVAACLRSGILCACFWMIDGANKLSFLLQQLLHPFIHHVHRGKIRRQQNARDDVAGHSFAMNVRGWVLVIRPDNHPPRGGS